MRLATRNQARWAVLMLVLALVLVALPVLAQTGGPYDLAWNRVAGGGARSEGGQYAVTGTIGQYDAGGATGSAAPGDYVLYGGLWGGSPSDPGPPAGYRVHLPVVLRSHGP
jgi:hypothetical protein